MSDVAVRSFVRHVVNMIYSFDSVMKRVI